MFDFHIHSAISFDSVTPAEDIARAAVERGMKEICFTDHWDYLARPEDKHDLFSLEEYARTYDSLEVEGLTIRRGIELGLNEWNVPHCKDTLKKRPFDFGRFRRSRPPDLRLQVPRKPLQESAVLPRVPRDRRRDNENIGVQGKGNGDKHQRNYARS